MSSYNFRSRQHIAPENLLRTGNDKILPRSVDKPDTSVVNPPGNLFQALDKFLPMKSDSNGGTLGNVIPSAYRTASTSYPTTPPVPISNPSSSSNSLDFLDDRNLVSRASSVLHYSDGLVLQCPPGYQVARITEQELRKYSRKSVVPVGLLRLQRLDPALRIFHYYDAPETTVTYECPFPDCNGTFSNTGLKDHFDVDHRPFQGDQTLTCKECPKSMQAFSYIEHFKDQHSGHSICCAYCGKHLLRRNTLPRHFGVCGPLKAYLGD
ncbi:hypothetical protein EDD85DRAFT_118187 [Armillaria nabsnona]|nr:hypothetical protein EDD85DRAFT_118187 [Armillaria nabsnona]